MSRWTDISAPIRSIILCGLVVVVILAIIAIANGGTPSEDDDYMAESTDTVALTTETTEPEAVCFDELSAWLEWVTQPGGSIMEAAAEFGMQSREYAIVQSAWTTFVQNRYQLGVDEASNRAAEIISDNCASLGSAYTVGHMPPG